MGVLHGDEVAYVFGQPLNLPASYNARERDLSMRIMQAFSRFSVTGLVHYTIIDYLMRGEAVMRTKLFQFGSKPVADETEWPKYTKEDPVYYIYDSLKTGTGRGPRSTLCEFWNGLMPEIRSYTSEYLSCMFFSNPLSIL